MTLIVRLLELLRRFSPRQVWLRADLHWIDTQIADELERQAKHDKTMRSLRAEKAQLEHALNPKRAPRGLAALKLRTIRRKRAAEYHETALRG